MTKPFLIVLLFASLIAVLLLSCNDYNTDKKKHAVNPTQKKEEPVWIGPDLTSVGDDEKGKLIKYGHELITNTAEYLGPQGSVQQVSNGMNCQNCHLNAGAKPFGNNYFAVYSTYPKYRERSGSNETIVKRVNDCFERSMNGKPLDSTGKEMNAIITYITWLGTDVPKGKSPRGSNITSVPFLDRAADPEIGKLVYTIKC